MVNIFGLNNTGRCSNGNKLIPAGVLSQVDSQYTLENMSISGPGRWADMDIMFVCYPEAEGMSWDEQTAHFALWATLGSPLMLSHDLLKTDARCLKLVGDREVLSVNQDVLASPAFPIMRSAGSDGNFQAFAKKLEVGFAVVLVNRAAAKASLRFEWEDLPGLDAAARFVVRDLLAHADRGVYQGGYTSRMLHPHEAELVKLVPIENVLV